MARFGQGFINALTRPSYAPGLFEAASALGSAPRRAAEEREREGMLQLVQEALISNDPTVMVDAGKKIFQTDPEMGAQLIQGAQKLRTTAQAGRTSRGLQGGLTAIQAAATRGVPLADLKEAQQSVISLGGTQDQISDAYKAGIPEAEEADDLSLTTSTILIDNVPTVVQTATNKKTGQIVSQKTIGTTEGKGKGESKKGLTALFAEQGVEVDLDTVDGIRAARNVALTDLSNASLAGLLDEMLVRKLPMNAADSVKMVRDSDPAFALNEELVEKAGRFKVLSALGKDDVAGVAALIERTVTSTTENDLRAVAELDRFRASKDIKQALTDWGLGLAAGRLSEDTISEYTQIMTGLETLAKNRIEDSINRLSFAAVTEKEQASIETARLYFGLEDGVEIINQ